MIRRPPRSTLFPSTPLFRSRSERRLQPLQRRPQCQSGGGRQSGVARWWSQFRPAAGRKLRGGGGDRDRKSTRLNSSHSQISYAVFCLKKKKNSYVKNRMQTH